MDNRLTNYIKCSAHACKYNDHEKCVAEKVDVGKQNAKTSLETECVTFIPRMS